MANGNDPANIPYIIVENGFYYVAYKEKAKVPEVVVSAKGVANGLSEEYNDGWDFGPDSYNPNSTANTPYTQTSGIQEAVSYASINGQEKIELATGTFNINTTISITSSHIHIKGDRSVIMPLSTFSGNSYGDCFVIDVDTPGFLEDISIDGLTFDFSNISGTLMNGIHVKYISATKELNYYNIKLKNISGFNLPIYSSDYPYDNVVIYVTATNTSPTEMQGVVIENFFSYNCQNGIAFPGTSGLSIVNVTMLYTNCNGINSGYLSPDSSVDFGPATLYSVTNAWITNPGNYLPYTGIDYENVGVLSQGSGWTLTNVVVGGFGIGMSLSNAEANWQCNVVSCQIGFNSGPGVYISGSTDNYGFFTVITATSVYGNGSGTGGGTGYEGSGITLSDVSCVVNSCVITDNAGYGIYKGATSSGLTPKIKILNTIFEAGGVAPNTSGTIYIGTNQSADEVVIYSTDPSYLPSLTTPSVPTSATAQQNTNPYAVDVYIYGGDVTEIQITRNGVAYTVLSVSTAIAMSGQAYKLNPGDSITITYSTAPSWEWLSD